MDSSIAVLLQAATMIGNAALDEASKRAVGDAWEAAKGAIKRKLGGSHPVPAIMDNLPAAAGNEVRMAALQGQLAPLQLGSDPDVLMAVERLAASMRHTTHIHVTAHEVKGAQIVQGPQTNYFN